MAGVGRTVAGMAAHSEVKAKTATLAAATADSVTLSGQRSFVEIVHHGDETDPIYFTVDSAVAAPTAAADDTEVILPGERLRVGPVRAGVSTVVNLVSAGTPTYTVIAVA